jgi:hydrogenase maturation protease
MTIRVLGLGNVLMGDDGFGPAVLHHLSTGWDFPAGVELCDLGTPGLDLIPYLSGADVILLVDTVRAQGPAGELRRYEKPQILANLPHPRVSPHDPGVKEALLALEFGGTAPTEVVLLGAIPQSSEMSTRLSPAVAASVGAAANAVVEELIRRGFPPVAREIAERPKAWWEDSLPEAP